MATIQIALPPKLLPVFTGEADYRGAYGGRGSAKTRSFAKMSAVRALMWAQAGVQGVIVCGRAYQNSLKESSLSEVKMAIQEEPWLSEHFDIGEEYVRTKDRRVSYDFVGVNVKPKNIKSKARILLFWGDEAEDIIENAWEAIVNTVREDGSEIWVTWNPELMNSATDLRFRVNPPARAKIIPLNWKDNPAFPATLNRKRLEDLEKRPDDYPHIWDGAYRLAVKGAVYGKEIRALHANNQICKVPYEAIKPVHMAWDLGWGDAMAIVLWQQVGYEYRILNYIEGTHRTVASYAQEDLMKLPYTYGHIYLPHDGRNRNIISGTSAEEVLKSLFPNCQVHIVDAVDDDTQHAAVRNVFPKAVFDEVGTRSLIERLSRYRYPVHTDGSTGQSPVHDASSHGAKAFAYMAMGYDRAHDRPKIKVGNTSAPSSSSWMAS
jgi:phage terminase large subunit